VAHPYRAPASFAVAPVHPGSAEDFRAAVAWFLVGISVVRACLDVAGGRLTAGGVGALGLLSLAFWRGRV
jgi:hypothetical protein